MHQMAAKVPASCKAFSVQVFTRGRVRQPEVSV